MQRTCRSALCFIRCVLGRAPLMCIVRHIHERSLSKTSTRDARLRHLPAHGGPVFRAACHGDRTFWRRPSALPLCNLWRTLGASSPVQHAYCGGRGSHALSVRFSTMTAKPNKAPAPNRRLRVPVGARQRFRHCFCARPASPAAAGEARL